MVLVSPYCALSTDNKLRQIDVDQLQNKSNISKPLFQEISSGNERDPAPYPGIHVCTTWIAPDWRPAGDEGSSPFPATSIETRTSALNTIVSSTWNAIDTSTGNGGVDLTPVLSAAAVDDDVTKPMPDVHVRTTWIATPGVSSPEETLGRTSCTPFGDEASTLHIDVSSTWNALDTPSSEQDRQGEGVTVHASAAAAAAGKEETTFATGCIGQLAGNSRGQQRRFGGAAMSKLGRGGSSSKANSNVRSAAVIRRRGAVELGGSSVETERNPHQHRSHTGTRGLESFASRMASGGSASGGHAGLDSPSRGSGTTEDVEFMGVSTSSTKRPARTRRGQVQPESAVSGAAPSSRARATTTKDASALDASAGVAGVRARRRAPKGGPLLPDGIAPQSEWLLCDHKNLSGFNTVSSVLIARRIMGSFQRDEQYTPACDAYNDHLQRLQDGMRSQTGQPRWMKVRKMFREAL